MPVGKIGQRRQVVMPKEICDELDERSGILSRLSRERVWWSLSRGKLMQTFLEVGGNALTRLALAVTPMSVEDNRRRASFVLCEL